MNFFSPLHDLHASASLMHSVSSQMAWVKAVFVIVNVKRIKVYKRLSAVTFIYASLLPAEYPLKPLCALTSGA